MPIRWTAKRKPGYVPGPLLNRGGRPVNLAQSARKWTSTVVTVIAGVGGLWGGFVIEQALQRTEVGVASKNAAYTELIRAGDGALTPAFISWSMGYRLAGGEEPLEAASIMAKIMDAQTAEDIERQDALRDAANQLRLVIDEDDVHLIGDFEVSLTAGLPLDDAYVASEGDWPTAGQRLIVYSDAKLALVNAFRSDVLNEDELSKEEADRMLVIDKGIIDLNLAAAGAAAALDRLGQAGQQQPATP